ncbi:MAG: HD domain-containing protein [Clostridia bacterium]|nr:HD domain-containing protein [Clostridia bacterium]MDH7572235.1 HD domain-containing protein [Clostridia bacterium]
MKDYRDPLYGFITVNDCEQRIIDTRYFQRLRNVNQLGTTFLVYPSAMHTRFEHSLGTLFVMDKMLDTLLSRYGKVLGWSPAEAAAYRRMGRLAGLLHDLGHAPFSHAAEGLFPGGLEHQDYTLLLITSTEIADLIDGFLGPGGATTVAEIAVGAAKDRNAAFVSELLTGDFGADRIDYLIRDSYHLGVQYGRFDVHRLLNTLMVRQHHEDGGPELVLEEGGIHTVEGFLLARYFMFLDVYYHKTRRILDYHLAEFLTATLKGGTYPRDVEDFAGWDDHRVWSLLNAHRNHDAARRLLERRHFRAAFETSDHPDPVELERFDWLKAEVKARFGEEQIRFDEATRAPYAYERPPIYVRHRDGYVPLKDRSSLVRDLRRIEKCRVYAEPAIRDEVESFCDYFWKQRQARRGGG